MAALDVFEDENDFLPRELVALDNVVLTPHLGSGVAEKREIMTHAVVDLILAFLEGNTPRDFFFNPEIYDKGA
jgi:lactate dehydrogenase-like 2-hydroxyacid dehydrogenase